MFTVAYAFRTGRCGVRLGASAVRRVSERTFSGGSEES